MPLSAELEKLLGYVPEAEREARRKELSALQEGSLRQDEFSRKMNDLDKRNKEAEVIHRKNREWFDTAKPQYEAMQKEAREAKERLAALETREDHPNDLESPDDQAALQRQLRVAREEVAATKLQLEAVATTVTEFQTMLKDGKLLTADDVNRRGDALGAAVLDIIDLQSRHRADFGIELPRQALLDEAQKRGGDLSAAYEFLTKESREKKLRETIEADVQKRWDEKHKNDNTPYAAGGGEPVLGPLQQRLQKKDSGIPDDVQADGSGRLAGLIAQEFRAEGKS
jgi:hypothetical protein